MPYPNIGAVPAQIKTHKGAKLTLAQANKWASIYDAIKAEGGVESPAAVAWTTWEKLYVKEGNAWVARKKAEVKYIKENDRIYKMEAVPGEGQGAGKPKQGAGGRDSCVCPECGHIAAHERGTPCVEQKCSKCGANMQPYVEKKSLANILGMAVFKTGIHNKVKYSDAVLDQMMANFDKLKDSIRPKLKITHKESQEKLAGLASYGDVKRIFAKIIDGIKTIFVDIANVPVQVINLIKDRRFPERSIEVYPEINVDGNKFKNVLRNVSLLGHEPPAVPGLEPVKLKDKSGVEYEEVIIGFTDVQEFEIQEKEVKEEMGDKVDVTAQFEAIQTELNKLKEDIKTKDSEIAKMKDQKEVERLTAEKKVLEEKVAELDERVTEFKKIEQKAKDGEAAEKELKTLKDKNRKSDIDGSIAAWTKEGKILPKQAPVLTALMESLDETKVVKFKVTDGDDEKEKESSPMQLVKDIFKDASIVVDFKEVSTDGEGDKPSDEIKDAEGREVDGVELDRKAKKFMAENKGVSYAEALIEVDDVKKSE